MVNINAWRGGNYFFGGLTKYIFQPYLVPFLRKSLPLLRRSMQNGGGSRPVQSQPIQVVERV